MSRGHAQEALRPRFLRRMKEDVETLPEKEEVVVWVELTAQQRIFYKGIYSGQVSFQRVWHGCLRKGYGV